MPATGKISLDASDYKRTLDEVKNKTKGTADEMSKAVGKFGSDVGKAGGAVKTLSAEVSGSFGQIGKVISSVAAGPVAALTAAIGVLIAVGKEMWDELTLSSEEYAAKLSAQVEMEEKRLGKIREAQQEEDAYMERLKELSEQETLSNSEKEEAAFLLETLSKRYGDFGASIDAATGKINGLYEAEQRLNELQKQQVMESLENQLKNKSSLSNKQAEDLIYGPWYMNYKSFTWGGDPRHKQKWDYMKMSTQEKLAYAQNQVDTATTERDIEGWSAVAKSLQEQVDLENRLNNLRKVGTQTVKEHAQEMKKASETERKSMDEQEKAWKTYNDARVKAEEDAAKRAEEAARRDLEAMKREQNARDKEKQSLRNIGLRASGQGKLAAREEAVLAATQRKGSELTADEYSTVVNMANRKFELENFKVAAPLDYAPRVNSLVARGGSDAPVSMPKIEDLQAQTLNNVKNIKDLAARFLDAVESWGTF